MILYNGLKRWNASNLTTRVIVVDLVDTGHGMGLFLLRTISVDTISTLFTSVDTCTDGSGPNYGRVGVRCGQETEIAEILRRSTCRFVIRVNTGEQCATHTSRYGSDEEQAAATARVNKVYEKYTH